MSSSKNNKSSDQDKALLDQVQVQPLDVVLYTLIFGLFPLDRQLHLFIILIASFILLIKSKLILKIPLYTALLAGIFIAFLIPSSLKALIPTFSIYVSTCWVAGLLFFLSLFKLDKESTKQNLLYSLKISFILSVFLLFIAACYQMLNQGGMPVINKSEIIHIFFRTENYVASYIILLLPFSLIRTTNKLLNFLSYVAIVIGLYLITTGVSQSNIVLSLIILISWLFIYRKKFIVNRKIIYSLCIVIVGLSCSFVLTQFGKSGNLKITSEFKGMSERYDLWEATLKLINENPIIGVGLGNWMISAEKFIDIRTQIVHPHNLYLEIGSEISMIALLCFIALFGIVIWKKLIKDKNKNYIDTACILSLFTYFINSFIYGTINHQYVAFSGITIIAFTVLYLLQSDIEFKNQIATKVLSAITIVFYIAIFAYQVFFYQSRETLKQKLSKKERKQNLLSQYDKNFYSHQSKQYSIAYTLVEKFDLSAEEKRFFTQEVAFQYPYDYEHVTSFTDILVSEKKYNQAIYHFKNLGFKSPDDYNFQLKLAELFYLNGEIKKGDEIINKIRNIPNESMASIGVDKFNEITRVKSKAYVLQQKYSK